MSSESMRKAQRGVSLVEVLIALLVLSIGLIGALKLQAEGVRQNADSRYTVLAATYAHDAMDAIAFDRSNAQASWMMSAGTAPSSLSGRAKEWLTALQRDLPDGKAAISCSSGDKKCTVTLTWVPPGRDQVEAKYEMYN